MIKQSEETRWVTEEMVCPNLALALIEVVESGDHLAAAVLVRAERYRRTQDGYYAPLGKMAIAFRDQWAPFYKMIEKLDHTKVRSVLICLWNADKGGREADEYLAAAERLLEQLGEHEASLRKKAAEAAQEMHTVLTEPRYVEDKLRAAAVGRRAADGELPSHIDVNVSGFRARFPQRLGPWRHVTSVRRGEGGLVMLDIEALEGDRATVVELNPNKHVTLRYRVEE